MAENGSPALPVLDQVPFEVSSKGMEETPFADLKLRLGEPYWMFHQGSCEHIWTIDEIRCVPDPFVLYRS